MIDHVGFPVSDYQRSKEFYNEALAPLGYTLIMEVSGAHTESGHPAAGFGADGKPDFWIGGEGGLEGSLISRSPPKIAPRSTPFTARHSQPAAGTMVHRACARNTTGIITLRSCSIPTVTMSRRFATHPDKG